MAVKRISGPDLGSSSGRQYKGLLKLTLILCVITAAIMVNYVSHLNRNLFSDYQQQLQVRDQLDVEWGQLLLEQSTFAAHARIEQLAKKKLAMKVPDSDEIVMVQQ